MGSPLNLKEVSSLEELEAKVASASGEIAAIDAKEEAHEEPEQQVQTQEEKEPKQEAVQEIEEDSFDADDVLSDEEREAVKQGWKPDGPLDAGEFIRRGELLDKISSLNKEIKQMRSAMEHQNKYMTQQQELGYKKALEDLQARRVEAIHLGDVEQVTELDKQIKDVEAQKPPTTDMENPIVRDFKARHESWINDPSLEGEEMRQFVSERDMALVQYNLSPEEHIKIIEQDLRKKFPSRFAEKKQSPRDVSVETSTATPRKTGKYSFDSLSATQKQVCRQFERKGIMTREEYVKQLKDLGEI